MQYFFNKLLVTPAYMYTYTHRKRQTDTKTDTHTHSRTHTHPVLSEKTGTFICELILEGYIYLRNTQKQLKSTNYVRNKSFTEFHVVYNGVCLKLLR